MTYPRQERRGRGGGNRTQEGEPMNEKLELAIGELTCYESTDGNLFIPFASIKAILRRHFSEPATVVKADGETPKVDPRASYDPRTNLHGQLYHKVFPEQPAPIVREDGKAATAGTFKFPRRLYVKEYHQSGDAWFWKSLCIVYDNESLGFLERLLTIEHKSEPA